MTKTLTWSTSSDWDNAQSETDVQHPSGSVEIYEVANGGVLKYPMVNKNNDTSTIEDYFGSYNGTNNGASYNSTGGPHGQGAYSFPAGGDYISVPNTAGIGSTNPRTLICWFNVNNNGSRQMIFGYGAGGTAGNSFEMEVNYPYNPDDGGSDNQETDSVGLHFWANSVTGPAGLISDYSSWHMFAATWDGSSSSGSAFNLYYDGNSVAVNDNISDSLSTNVDNFAMGSSLAHGDTTTNTVDGSVAFPMLFNRVLSASEIQYIYDSYKTSTRSGKLTTARKVA